MVEQKGSVNYFLLIGIVLILGIFGFYFNKISQANKIKNEIIPKIVRKALQNDKIKFKISNFKEISGVYQFEVNVNNQKFVSYITKDGKIFYSGGIKVDEILKTKTQDQPTTKSLSCNDLNQSEKPILTAYVMANCPYGLQMQRVFKKAIEENSDLKNYLQIKYIFDSNSNFDSGDLDSLHGKEEAQENLRQICIREEQKDLYWNYVSCYMKKENNSKSCLDEVGVDNSKLSQCMKDKNRGLKYAKNDFDRTQKLGVSGSPTLVLNDKQIISEEDFGGRIPNAIKEILCCSAGKKLSFCQTDLSKNTVAVHFSETDETVAGASTQQANCN